MNNINITTELCAEDRARIDKLIAAIESQTVALGNVGTPFQTVNNLINVTEAKAPQTEADAPTEPMYEEGTGVNDLGFEPVETDKEDEPEAPQETAEPKHTKAELQQKVVGLVSKGKKEEVKAIIKEYAAKVSEVPEDKVDEVWAKLEKLEG